METIFILTIIICICELVIIYKLDANYRREQNAKRNAQLLADRQCQHADALAEIVRAERSKNNLLTEKIKQITSKLQAAQYDYKQLERDYNKLSDTEGE